MTEREREREREKGNWGRVCECDGICGYERGYGYGLGFCYEYEYEIGNKKTSKIILEKRIGGCRFCLRTQRKARTSYTH